MDKQLECQKLFIVIFFLVAFFSVNFFPQRVHALCVIDKWCAKDKIEEASNLNRVSDYAGAKEKVREALAKLAKAYADNPDDLEIQFLIGQAHLLQGDRNKAEKHFLKAGPHYAQKSADYFMKIGNELFDAGQEMSAVKLYRHACNIYSQYRHPVAKKFFAHGNLYLTSGDFQSAETYFSTAKTFDPGMSKNIANAWFMAGKRSAQAEKAMLAFGKSLSESNVYKQEIIDIAPAFLKKIPIDDGERIARRYVPAIEITIIKTTYNLEIYHKGDQADFDLTGNNTESGWIRTVNVDTITFKWLKSLPGRYYILTRSGQKYSLDKLPNAIREDFKLIREDGDAKARVVFS